MDDLISLARLHLLDKIDLLNLNGAEDGTTINKNELYAINEIARRFIIQYAPFFEQVSINDVGESLQLLNEDKDSILKHYLLLVNYLLDLEEVYIQLKVDKIASELSKPKTRQRKKKQ